MNELERAGTVLRERPTPATSLETIERRATELTRRRRIGWAAVATAVLVVSTVIGVGALRARSNDESIVVGPGPTSDEQTLVIPMVNDGGPDAATAAVAAIERRLSEADFADVTTSTDGSTLVVSGPASTMGQIAAWPWLFASTVDFRTVLSNIIGLCPDDASNASQGFTWYAGPQGTCYEIGHGSGENLSGAATATATLAGQRPALLLATTDNALRGWANDLGGACGGATEAPTCPPPLQLAFFTEFGIGFVLTPLFDNEGGDGTQPLFAVTELREARAGAAVINNPLPEGVLLSPGSETIPVQVALRDIPAGSSADESFAVGAIGARPIPEPFVPDTAVRDASQIAGLHSVVDIPRGSVIVEGMFE